MAYLDTIKLVTGDTLPDLRFQLKDSATSPDGVAYDENEPSTWAPLDLTDATVKLRIRQIGETTITAEITGIVSDAANGIALFAFTNNSFTESGLYEGEIEVSYAGGGILTMYDLVKFNVRSDFD
jgi:hypothetical protein